MILALHTVGCHARPMGSLAMTKGVRLNPASISPSLAEGAGGGSLRVSVTSVATNRQRILMILALHTVDCFGCRLAMTQNSACKNIHCHVERSETSLLDSALFDSL